MLPTNFSNATYWEEIYPQPLTYWQGSLDTITRRHFRETVRWERASLGRNVVFLSETWVLKLGPPGWVEDTPRETSALRWVTDQLPVQTPELIQTGFLEEWSYIIQRRLPGRNLHELWKTLDQEQRERIAIQHGEILAALHGLDLPDLSAQKDLSLDWHAMIAQQRLNCSSEMRKAGVHPALVDKIENYLADADVLLQNESKYVLLHGDLTHLNFLIEPTNWQITGLIDWGDAKLGPPGHEFISPGVHMYLGDRTALNSFYKSCGKALAPVHHPVELMARAMLYYAGDFAALLQKIPETRACQDWACVARYMW